MATIKEYLMANSDYYQVYKFLPWESAKEQSKMALLSMLIDADSFASERLNDDYHYFMCTNEFIKSIYNTGWNKNTLNNYFNELEEEGYILTKRIPRQNFTYPPRYVCINNQKLVNMYINYTNGQNLTNNGQILTDNGQNLTNNGQNLVLNNNNKQEQLITTTIKDKTEDKSSVSPSDEALKKESDIGESLTKKDYIYGNVQKHIESLGLSEELTQSVKDWVEMIYGVKHITLGIKQIDNNLGLIGTYPEEIQNQLVKDATLKCFHTLKYVIEDYEKKKSYDKGFKKRTNIPQPISRDEIKSEI